MATVLEEYITEGRRSVVRFCEQKGSIQRILLKKYFLFTVRSVYRVKRFTTGSRNSLKDFRKSQMMPDQVQKWLSRLLCCWFRCTGKAMFFFYIRISHVTFYIHLWPIYWLLILFILDSCGRGLDLTPDTANTDLVDQSLVYTTQTLGDRRQNFMANAIYRSRVRSVFTLYSEGPKFESRLQNLLPPG
jgi:hypothetical protein